MKIKGHRRIYSSRYALSGVVICGVCGDIYRRVVWTSHGKRSVVWRCVNRVNGGKKNCCSRTIREDELKGAVVKAMFGTAFCTPANIGIHTVIPCHVESVSLIEKTSL